MERQIMSTIRAEITGRKVGIKELTERYGVVPRTVDRWLADADLGFPKPLVINGRRYWALSEIEQWEHARAVHGR
jgi:predicted DNA-binding transcriptional regulator AlpA